MNYEYYNAEHTNAIEGGGDYPEKIAFFVNSLQKIKHIKKQKKLSILDVGCHAGKISRLFLEFGEVYGLDLNEKAVEEAKKSKIRAKVGDVFQVDRIFKDLSFDVIIAGDIIEHVFDTDLFLQKLRNMLSPDGVLLLSTPNLLSLGRRYMALIGKNPYCEFSAKEDGINVGHIRYYTYDNLFSQLLENKYQKVKIETDIVNFPVKFIDQLLVRINPRLGRELYATAYK